MNARITELWTEIYGPGKARETVQALENLLECYRSTVCPPDSYASRSAGDEPAGFDAGGGDGLSGGDCTDVGTGPPGRIWLDHRDAVMIAYGDHLRGRDALPLAYLHRFMADELEGTVSGVHVLPFSPYSSDDGFSVIDYRQVNPELGSWADLERLGRDFILMVDLVLNHCSSRSEWFRAFLRDEAPYNEYFITVPEGTDTSGVVRPRALPLLTEYQTAHGPKLVWTTFSADQVDLNYANPRVLLEILDILLLYLQRGAQIIRLDAVAYLWKELGTPCIHHPKAHAVVRLMRAVIDEIAPWALIITETNVPHTENISYFGSGADEAHMVYNFSLPPLTLDAFLQGDARYITEWASTLPQQQLKTAFFNFLASHDGVGLLPAQGILPDERISNLIETVQARGGLVSYKTTPSGEVPYELNVSYVSAIADPALPTAQRAAAFLCSQAVMLAIAGVPGIYLHSLLGSENWTTGVAQTGHSRSINRRKPEYDTVIDELGDPESLRAMIFEGYKDLLRGRGSHPALAPAAHQRIIGGSGELFAVLRSAGGERVLCLHNVTAEPGGIQLSEHELGLSNDRTFRDLITGDVLYPTRENGNRVSIELGPYEVLWLAYTGRSG